MSPRITACLAATWLVWGSTYLAIQWALVSFPPFWQIGTRFIAAGGLLLLFMRWRGAPWPSRREWRNALIVGTLLLGCGTGGTAFAEQSLPSGLVVIFIAVVPALIALFNLGFGERPARPEIAGIALGIAGVVLLTRGSAFSAAPAGLLAITIATIGWSLGSVLGRLRLPIARGAMGYASEMLAGGVVLMVVSLLVGERVAWPPEALAAGAWVYLVVFGSWIGFSAYLILLAEASPALASSYTFVNPVIALFLGIALNGEKVSRFEWLAVGVILAGVLLLVLGRKRT